MSIYPVKLGEWYPKGDEKYEICFEIVKSSRCPRCGRVPKYTSAIGMHAVPWGYGCEEIFCSSRCFRRKRRRSLSSDNT